MYHVNITRRPSKRSALMPDGAPPPSYRHAAPCGPWPWTDLGSESEDNPLMLPTTCSHPNCNICPQWMGYPQSLFPNWTPRQITRSGIAKAIQNQNRVSVVYQIDVLDGGKFEETAVHSVDDERAFWPVLSGKRDSGIRIRALFVEDLSGPVLQMLGTTYNIEPFYFSSSLNWISSRFQEDARAKEGDHVTITLTFLCVTDDPGTFPESPTESVLSHRSILHFPKRETRVVDTQAPLVLSSNEKILFLDLLAIHMVRDAETSTMISYHPSRKQCTTTAKQLHSRVKFAGDSVYWQHIFTSSTDPTFVLLPTIWHAVYAWDEALEMLYDHLCVLESKVMQSKTLEFTAELYAIRVHLLHWESLLDDLHKSVRFILNTPNPAMDSASHTEEERQSSRALLQKECENVLSEVTRLQNLRLMQDSRLKNAMDLVFTSVNIDDSKQMKEMTELSIRDNAAMKQIAFLTMLYLPASFLSSAFSMNVKEINPASKATLADFFGVVLLLTSLTIWAVGVFQSKYFYDNPAEIGLMVRLFWPITWMMYLFSRARRWLMRRKSSIINM